MTENWLFRAEAVCMASGGHCCDDAHFHVTKKRYDKLIALINRIDEPDTNLVAEIARRHRYA